MRDKVHHESVQLLAQSPGLLQAHRFLAAMTAHNTLHIAEQNDQLFQAIVAVHVIRQDSSEVDGQTGMKLPNDVLVLDLLV